MFLTESKNMFDIGVNLTSTQFASDRKKVITRARDAGVTGMLITGTNALESQQAQRLAEAHPGYCWSTAGVHPHHASEWSQEVANTLRRLAEKAQVVAIGECGLDFIVTCPHISSRNMRLTRNWH